MINWESVAKHLAIVVMKWRQEGERFALHLFWVDSNENDRVLAVDWQPHKNWRHTGIVIDAMKETRHSYLCLFYSRDEQKYDASFYNLDTQDDGPRTWGETEQEAIALAAALATGYVNKSEAQMLAQSLLKDMEKMGLYCLPDTEKCLLKLLEDTFENAHCEWEKRKGI